MKTRKRGEVGEDEGSCEWEGVGVYNAKEEGEEFEPGWWDVGFGWVRGGWDEGEPGGACASSCD